jgi:hypothetical protein
MLLSIKILDVSGRFPPSPKDFTQKMKDSNLGPARSSLKKKERKTIRNLDQATTPQGHQPFWHLHRADCGSENFTPVSFIYGTFIQLLLTQNLIAPPHSPS